jgi:hypothetical protein
MPEGPVRDCSSYYCLWRAAVGVCVGLGLMYRASWARTAAIILGILALFHPPFGTALGVYSLWVLLADESGDEYQCLARAS